MYIHNDIFNPTKLEIFLKRTGFYWKRI